MSAARGRNSNTPPQGDWSDQSDSNNVRETYTYGVDRNRLINEHSSQRTYYVWGGGNPLIEYTEATASSAPAYSKSYIYAGSRLLMTATKASSTTETKELHHPDRLGTQLVTNGGTGSSYRQKTLPFGTTILGETTGNSNQVFTRYDRSGITGLDYGVNRTFSKDQSRFTQVDPLGMSAASIGNPQSNNLYAYTQNMPTDLVDPSGLNAAPSYDKAGNLIKGQDVNGAWRFFEYDAAGRLKRIRKEENGDRPTFLRFAQR